MRLYLSSYRLGNHVEQLVSSLPKKPKALIVANALDVFSESSRQKHMTEVYNPYSELKGHGFSVSDLDLRSYFGRAIELTERLSEADLVWVLGGNSFVLRRVMAHSGFDAEVVRRLNSDDLMYGGFSAGAVVAPSSLRGIDLMDDPHSVPEGYPPEVIWNGLGVIDFSIVPHFRSNHPEAPMAEVAKDYFEKYGLPFKTLMDGDAVLRYGDTIKILRDM